MTTGRSQAPTTSCPGCSRGRSRRDVTRGPADVRGVSQPPGRAESRGGRPVSSWGPTHRERLRTASRAESAWLARVRLVVNGGMQRQCRGLPAPGRSRREHPGRHGGRAQWVCLPRCPHGNQVPGRCRDVANHWSLRGGRWLRVRVEVTCPSPGGDALFSGVSSFPTEITTIQKPGIKTSDSGTPCLLLFPWRNHPFRRRGPRSRPGLVPTGPAPCTLAPPTLLRGPQSCASHVKPLGCFWFLLPFSAFLRVFLRTFLPF